MQVEQPPCQRGLSPRILRGHELAQLGQFDVASAGLDDTARDQPIPSGRKLVIPGKEEFSRLVELLAQDEYIGCAGKSMGCDAISL